MNKQTVNFWIPWIILFFIFSYCACAPESIQPNKVETANSLMTDHFWGMGDDRDLPRLFESVCEPDPGMCGDTHFGANEDSFIVSFSRYLSKDEALEELEKVSRKASLEVRSGDVRNNEGSVVGKKVVLWEDIDRFPDRYKLIWVRGNRLATVSAEKLESINLYETDRGL